MEEKNKRKLGSQKEALAAVKRAKGGSVEELIRSALASLV